MTDRFSVLDSQVEPNTLRILSESTEHVQMSVQHSFLEAQAKGACPRERKRVMPGQRKYRRLDRAERAAIERGLDAGRSCRQIAKDLGRSPSSVSAEVKANRTVTKGAGKGERVGEVPEDACPKLLAWPHACNGCKYRRYHCSRKWRCEYSAARAQAMSDELLSAARRGVDRGRDEFESMMETIRSDVARGLSPVQISIARASEFSVHPSTIYRWIEKNHGGMSNIELLRKVGYKKRRRDAARATPHGPSRSYAAFMQMDGEDRASACEMDTVIGRRRDEKCVLTPYLRPYKLQLCMLLPEKSSSAVAAALDALEKAIGKSSFQRFFGILLTDNGAEFSDFAAIEKSALPGKKARTRVYYCDVRASQQKASCEKNHVELRRLLPKGRGISFDDLVAADMAVLMSQMNSSPRPSLGGMSPAAMLLAAHPEAGRALLDALGVEAIAYEALLLSVKAINEARGTRGEEPLI